MNKPGTYLRYLKHFTWSPQKVISEAQVRIDECLAELRLLSNNKHAQLGPLFHNGHIVRFYMTTLTTPIHTQAYRYG